MIKICVDAGLRSYNMIASSFSFPSFLFQEIWMTLVVSYSQINGRAGVSLALLGQAVCCSLPVSLNSWVDESNVVLVVQVGSDLLGDLDESLKSESI